MGSKGAQSSYNLFSPQCSIYHICKINVFGLQKYSLIKDLHIVIRLSIFNHMIVVFFSSTVYHITCFIQQVYPNMWGKWYYMYMYVVTGPIPDIALEGVCLIFSSYE